MNLSTIALLLLAWQLLGKKNNSSPKLQDFAGFLNDDTKNIIDCVGKLSSNDATNADKTGAILQMMTNPTVMSFASSLFGNGEKAGGDETKQEPDFGKQGQKTANQTPLQNDEGYIFGQSSPQAQEFFGAINNIADAEVKHKLYWFYDNWYLSK